MRSASLSTESSNEKAARQSRLTGYVFAALGAILFSSKGIAIKLVYAEGIDPETILALRLLIAMPIYAAIGVYSLMQTRRAGIAFPDRWLVAKVALVGMLGYWVSSYLDFRGLVTISAQFERVILFTYPLWIVLFGAAFFGQPVKARALIAFLVSYSGIALTFSQFAHDSKTGVTIGVAFVLASAVSFAFYQLLAKGLIARTGSRLFTCIAMLAAGLGVVLQFALTHPMSALIVSPKVFAYSVFLGIGATVLPSFFMNGALQRISAQSNSTIGMISPVSTIFLAMLVLGEHLTATEWLGTALVVAGIAWFTYSDRR